MGEHIGLFQSMEKLALRLVARGSNGKLDASLSVHLFRLDAYHVNADRQDPLKIHKHIGPVEASCLDNVINKRGAVVQLGQLRFRLFQRMRIDPLFAQSMWRWPTARP